jgi:hypothetical protein
VDPQHSFTCAIDGVLVDILVMPAAVRRWNGDAPASLTPFALRNLAEYEAVGALKSQGGRPGERWLVRVGERAEAERVAVA